MMTPNRSDAPFLPPSLFVVSSFLSSNVVRGLGSASESRIEKDTFGDIKVQADRYWGAQTQR